MVVRAVDGCEFADEDSSDVHAQEGGADQGSFPEGTPMNGVSKVILTVGSAFTGTQ